MPPKGPVGPSQAPAQKAKQQQQQQQQPKRPSAQSAAARPGQRRPNGPSSGSNAVRATALEQPLQQRVLRWQLGVHTMAEETQRLEAQAQRLHKDTYDPPGGAAAIAEFASAALSLVTLEVCAELEQVVAASEELEWEPVSVAVEQQPRMSSAPFGGSQQRQPPQQPGRGRGGPLRMLQGALLAAGAGRGGRGPAGAPPSAMGPGGHGGPAGRRPPFLKLMIKSARGREAGMRAADAVDAAAGVLPPSQAGGPRGGDPPAPGGGHPNNSAALAAAALLEDEALATLDLRAMRPGLINAKGPLGCKPTDWVALSTEPISTAAMWGGGGGAGGVVHALGLVTGLTATGPHTSDAEVEVAWPEPGSDLHRLLFPQAAAVQAAEAEGEGEGAEGAEDGQRSGSSSSEDAEEEEDLDEDARAPPSAAAGAVPLAQQRWFFSVIGTGASSLRTFTALRGAKDRAARQQREAAAAAVTAMQHRQALSSSGGAAANGAGGRGARISAPGGRSEAPPAAPPAPPPPPTLLQSVLCPGPRVLHGLDLGALAQAFPHMQQWLGSVEEHCTRVGRLNPSQVRAVQQVLAAGSVALTEREQGHATGHQVLLVQGPPGTGKTSTIACLLGLLVSGGGALSSLLVAPTNTAVQEVAHRFLGNLHAQRGATLPLQQEGAGGVVRLRDLALLAKDEVVRAKVGATHALALAQQQQPTAPSVPPPQQQHLAAPRPPSIGYSLLEVCSETRAARLYTALLDPRDSVWEAAARLVWAFEGGPGPGAGGEGSRGVGRQVGQVRRCLRLLRAQALLLWEHLPLALVPRALQQQQQQQQQQAQVPPPAPAPPAALRPCLDEVLLRLAHACGEAEGRLERALAARTAAAAAAAPPLSAKQRDALDFMAVLTEGDGGEGFAAVWRAAEAAQALRGTWPEWERGEVVRECGVKRPDEAVGWLEKQVLAHVRLVFCTVSMCGRKLLHQARQLQPRAPGGGGGARRPGFDVCIVDEASQLAEPQTSIILEAFPDLPVLALVGDPNQLPSTVKSPTALKLGLGRSLMDRLCKLGMAMHMLNTQYRMHPHISLWPSRAFYNAQLLDSDRVLEPMRCGHLAFLPLFQALGAYRVVHVGGGAGEEMTASSSSSTGAATTGGGGARSGTRVNRAEAELVARAVRALVAQFQSRRLPLPWQHLGAQHLGPQQGEPPFTIGVISPYNGQVRLMSELLADLLAQCGRGSSKHAKAAQPQQPQQPATLLPGPAAVPASRPQQPQASCGFSLEVRSVDGFQGREMDVVLVSTVRSNTSGALGFLSDERRLNVAITRGRHAVWLFGDTHTLRQGDQVWHRLVEDAWARKALVDGKAVEQLLPPLTAAPATAAAQPLVPQQHPQQQQRGAFVVPVVSASFGGIGNGFFSSGAAAGGGVGGVGGARAAQQQQQQQQPQEAPQEEPAAAPLASMRRAATVGERAVGGEGGGEAAAAQRGEEGEGAQQQQEPEEELESMAEYVRSLALSDRGGSSASASDLRLR